MSAVCIATVLPEATASAAEKKMLVLGDSISAGYGLANGELGYYDYVAEYGGYSMTNLAVSGDTTVDLLEVIAKDNTQKAVKDADLICISIGGNDLLQAVQGFIKENKLQKDGESLTDMAKRLQNKGSLVVDLNTYLRESSTTWIANIQQIETELRALNSDTEIVFQTLYNPIDTNTTTYQGEDYSKYYEILNTYAKGAVKTFLNDSISSLKTVKCADVFSAFDGTGWVYVRSAQKDIHPTPVGHALIAATILDVLNVKNNKPTSMFNTVAKLSKADFSSIPSDDYNRMMAYCPSAFGDVDGNGKIDADDSNLVLLHYLNTMMNLPSELTADQLVRASVYREKTITADDSNAILKYYLANMLNADTTWGNLL